MDDYRIKKITLANGCVYYLPQKKIFWFWQNIGPEYTDYSWAYEEIVQDYYRWGGKQVEYLEPTPPKKSNLPPETP